MPEKHETELKFHVSNPDRLRKFLLQAGLVFVGRDEEENIRFDDRQRSLTARKVVLRMRHAARDGGHNRVTLTVKTPALAQDEFKTRREIETEVSDGDALIAALGVLGYQPYWRYEKRREIFTANEVEANLDHLPYGWFLELEGTPEGIRKLASKLGLKMRDGLTLSYAEIFETVRKGMNLNVANLTFAEFEGLAIDPRFFRKE